MTADRRLYEVLRRRLEEVGFFAPAPAFYATLVAVVSILFAALYLLVLGAPLDRWSTVGALGGLGLLVVQFGFLGHDAGHGHVSRRGWLNDLVGYLGYTVVGGVPWGWWRWSHNLHHASSNVLGKDPDIQSSILALNPADAARGRYVDWVVRHQARLVWLLYAFHPFSMRATGLKWALKRRSGADLVSFALHLILWIGIPWAYGSLGTALVVYLVVTMLTGWIYGPIFVTNHNGAALVEPVARGSWLRHQMSVTADIDASPALDLFMGGQNFHVIHHLFPAVSRARFRRGTQVLRELAREHRLPYRVDTPLQSMRRVSRFLRDMAKLRSERSEHGLLVAGNRAEQLG